MMMMMMMLTGLSSKLAEGKSNTHRLSFLSPRRREHEPGRARLLVQADHALRVLC